MNKDGYQVDGTQDLPRLLAMKKSTRWNTVEWAATAKVSATAKIIMKIRISELRKLIRRALAEGPSGPGITSDPTDIKGFYSYDLERGTDIHGYWYKSPGDKGSNDPMRPEDPEEYIGFKTKGATPEDAAAEAAPETETPEV